MEFSHTVSLKARRRRGLRTALPPRAREMGFRERGLQAASGRAPARRAPMTRRRPRAKVPAVQGIPRLFSNLHFLLQTFVASSSVGDEEPRSGSESGPASSWASSGVVGRQRKRSPPPPSPPAPHHGYYYNGYYYSTSMLYKGRHYYTMEQTYVSLRVGAQPSGFLAANRPNSCQGDPAGWARASTMTDGCLLEHPWQNGWDRWSCRGLHVVTEALPRFRQPAGRR